MIYSYVVCKNLFKLCPLYVMAFLIPQRHWNINKNLAGMFLIKNGKQYSTHHSTRNNFERF